MPFARVCGKMRWQFGGNLQPVRMICEFDWRECPSAIVSYIWSEIVTDVVECLTNEWLLWRVIAMLFVCTLLVHTIYSKTRLMDETSINRQNLNVVGCKVQDLELKVNILTYKMQYGTWPLPRQIRGNGIEAGLRNVRLTLTNSNDRNAWLKHMLLSPSENAEFVPFAKIGPRSVRCLTKLINLETKYMSSRFGRDPSPASNRAKSSGSDKSVLRYEKRSRHSSDSLEGIIADKPIPKSENLGMRQKDSSKSSRRDTNCRSETQVVKYRKNPKSSSRNERRSDAPSDKKIEQIFANLEEANSSVQLLKYNPRKSSKVISESARKIEDTRTIFDENADAKQQPKNREHAKSFARKQRYEIEAAKRLAAGARKSEAANETPEERIHSTHETLHQVREKLEDLHSVLRIYGSSETATTNEKVSSKKELAESILQDLKNLGNLPTESESDDKTSGYVPRLLDSCTEETRFDNEKADSTSEFEQCRSDRDSSSPRSYENSCRMRDDENQNKTDSQNVYSSASSREQYAANNYDEKPRVAEIPAVKARPVESSDDEYAKPTRIQIEDTAQFLSDSSQTELSKDSDVDDKSNATLLREALKFKKALLSQIEQEKEAITASRDADSQESKLEESDGEYDEPQWPKVKNFFQSKLLDIISEEQSASSSTEKTTNNCALAKGSKENEITVEKIAAPTSEGTNENSLNSKLALISESSEYFSLSNLEEKLIAQTTVSLTRKEAIESSSEFTEDEPEKDDEDSLPKNISDLVNQSVQNIREYIEVFSQMQNDAIAETKRAILDDHTSIPCLKDCSSDDSIMHFVNTVAMADSLCEQLPGKLSEPLINTLLELETMESEEESPDSSDYKPDFSLKRRPGSISLAEQNNKLSSECHEARSLFESANSEICDEDKLEAGTLSSEPSCKELLMDYSLETDSDFTDDKLSSTLNLIEFDEENAARSRDDWDERARIVDSPLTGRTVIRATSNSATYPQADSTNSFDLHSESEERQENDDVEESSSHVVPESSSIYFTDDVSISETIIKSPEAEPSDDVSESSTWILENSETNVELLRDKLESKDSAISETLEESTDLVETAEETVEDHHERLNSGKTIVEKIMEMKKKLSSKPNLSSDTSGTYMDAKSQDFLNSSGTSLGFDKNLVNPSANRIENAASSKSARGSSSTPLQQRIPWNAPKRGSSLNNASSARTKKPEKSTSKHDKSKEIAAIDKPNNTKSRQIRPRSSSGKEIKARSNFNLNGTKDLESSSMTSGRRSGKSNIELPERRSRSYVTPRKSEASPRNSVTSQPSENPRQSRARRDIEKSGTTMKSEKTSEGSSEKGSSKYCVAKTSSKSCIPILKSRLESVRQIRAKSPMRGPLTMSTSSWSPEPRGITSDSPMESEIPSEGQPEVGRDAENSAVVAGEPHETVGKIGQRNEECSSSKIPVGRTVIYVNIVTEHEHSATRVVNPKKFLEYLKDRDLKIQTVLNQEIDAESSLTSTAETSGSPRILTVVSSAVKGAAPSDGELPPCSNNSPMTGSWSFRVEQREIEVSAKPSVIDTSTSISGLPDMPLEARRDVDKFKIFEVPKELTKDEYILLLEALNQDPNLHQLREMHKLCNKLGVGFHE